MLGDPWAPPGDRLALRASIVGEIAFYLDVPRSASVVAETGMVVWRLSRDAMEELRTTHSDVAAKFHEAMAAMLATRLANTNKLVRLLAD